MNRLCLIAFIIVGYTSMLSAQKSKVIGVFELIEKGKYEEAKIIIENATEKKSTSEWSRTWYARGLLCQKAYKTGMEKDDKKLSELYPDQLFVAFNSYERARYYDKHDKYDKLLPPRYALLANDLSKLGENYYNKKDYNEALRAYEYALRVYKSNILDVSLDTNLVYNCALSAYNSKNWDVAVRYLSELNKKKYSSNVPHLLYSVYLMQSDTTTAHKVLLEGINTYEDNEELVLLLVDLLFEKKDQEKAVKILNDASKNDTSNYMYPYTMGLLYQKTEEYNKAIDSYKMALDLPSDTIKIYTNIGTCYYNMGAEMEERARTIKNNTDYLEAKQKSVVAFNSAIEWFEKAYEMDNNIQEIISKLSLLYKALDKKEKLKSLQVN